MPPQNTPYLIGITGGSGSGKTLFIKRLKALFSTEEVCVLSQDNYYIPRDQQPLDDEGIQNFDTPQSIHQDEFVRDVRLLKQKQSVQRLEYTYNNPKATPQTLTFAPAPVIVVEGIFVFYLKELLDLLDLKVFIDAEDHLMLKRRIIRDATERGYDMDDVLYRFDKHVIPTYRQYIEPFKKQADLIIPNNIGFESGLTVLENHIRHLLSSRSNK
ncbi:MAG: uridine kinase [Cyclobacteriaceae bacterium]